MQGAAQTVVSGDEYLALERKSETKHELVNGVIVAMAGASFEHNTIAANLLIALGVRLRGRPCRPLGSDQRIHIPATGLFTYPDLSVVCGRPEFHPEDGDTLLNPRVIIEVLSDSTEAYDRGAKFSHYRSIPSLAEYVLAAQDEPKIEHYRRLETGQWILTEFKDEGAAVAFPALGCEVPLAEVYEESAAAR